MGSALHPCGRNNRDAGAGARFVTPGASTEARRRPRAAATAPASLRLQLLDSFALVRGDEPVALPPSVQRLVAFVTIHNRLLVRQYVAGSLWPETTEQSAGANLRSALWRLNYVGV